MLTLATSSKPCQLYTPVLLTGQTSNHTATPWSTTTTTHRTSRSAMSTRCSTRRMPLIMSSRATAQLQMRCTRRALAGATTCGHGEAGGRPKASQDSFQELGVGSACRGGQQQGTHTQEHAQSKTTLKRNSQFVCCICIPCDAAAAVGCVADAPSPWSASSRSTLPSKPAW